VFVALAVTVLAKAGPPHFSVAVLSPAASPHGQLTDIATAMIYGITAFAGYEAAAAMGEEARNTRRAIPASTTGVVTVVGIFYLLVVLAEVFGAGRNGIPALIGHGICSATSPAGRDPALPPLHHVPASHLGLGSTRVTAAA